MNGGYEYDEHKENEKRQVKRKFHAKMEKLEFFFFISNGFFTLFHIEILYLYFKNLLNFFPSIQTIAFAR